MEIEYASAPLARLLNTEAETIKMWGAQRSRKVRQRMAELVAMPNLATMSTLIAARLAALDGDRCGQYSVEVLAPFHLVFEPIHLEQGQVRHDLRKIKNIRILEVTSIE